MQEIREIDIDDVVIGERFREDPGDLASMVSSIKEKGLLQPITVTPDNTLLMGHRRLLAAQLAGMDTIPALVRDTVDELDFREIELYENLHRKDLSWHERAALEARIFDLKKTSEGWSQRQTAEFLQESPGGLNRHLQLADAVEVIPELKNCKNENEAWKTLQRVREKSALEELSRRKDVKRSPIATVVNKCYMVGDAIDGMASMDPECFGFAEVDPPYGVNLIEMKKTLGGPDDLDEYHEVKAKEYGAFLLSAATELHRVMKNNAFCIWWFGPTHFELVKRSLKKAKFQIDDIPGIWYKGPVGQTMQPDFHLANSYEPFFICRKGKPILHQQGRSNVFYFSPVIGPQKVHPTERPLSLMAEILSTFSTPGVNMISPFLGSGVAIRAAQQCDMSCIGWDLSEENKQRALLKVEGGMDNK